MILNEKRIPGFFLKMRAHEKFNNNRAKDHKWKSDQSCFDSVENNNNSKSFNVLDNI